DPRNEVVERATEGREPDTATTDYQAYQSKDDTCDRGNGSQAIRNRAAVDKISCRRVCSIRRGQPWGKCRSHFALLRDLHCFTPKPNRRSEFRWQIVSDLEPDANLDSYRCCPGVRS